jgi:hypothetical protein
MSDPTTEAVYAYICDYISRMGLSPSQREIAQGCYLSQPSARMHIQKLVAQGRLTYEPGKARTLKLNTP